MWRLTTLALGVMLAGTAAAAPARVVSVNLCTDQLAMLLADPGQLISVSHLARDPQSSVMVAEAAGLPLNRGGAEEVFLMAPDLVLAGEWSNRTSLDLLRRLGISVLELPVATQLQDVPDHLRLIGAALGHPTRAETLALAFEQDLAVLRVPDTGLEALIYHPNGYTTGAGTLADDILRAAGFRNMGARVGVMGGGLLPLERLVIGAPDLVVTSTPYPGWSRSEELLRHPALVEIRSDQVAVSGADWVCALPQVLGAVRRLSEARMLLQSKPNLYQFAPVSEDGE